MTFGDVTRIEAGRRATARYRGLVEAALTDTGFAQVEIVKWCVGAV